LALSNSKIYKNFNHLLLKRLENQKHKIGLPTIPSRGLPLVGAAHHGQRAVATIWPPFSFVLDRLGWPSFTFGWVLTEG